MSWPNFMVPERDNKDENFYLHGSSICQVGSLSEDEKK